MSPEHPPTGATASVAWVSEHSRPDAAATANAAATATNDASLMHEPELLQGTTRKSNHRLH